MRIALFASYNASILETVLENGYNVVLIITNNSDAYVREKAKTLSIPCIVVNKTLHVDPDQKILELLKEYQCDLIVLAGYMKFVDRRIIQKYQGRIINSHPSLLPKFGGQGMYGRKVHEAVLKAKELYSGVTVHQVTNEYDKGDIIIQKRIAVDPSWGVEELEQRVKQLEKEAIIEALALL